MAAAVDVLREAAVPVAVVVPITAVVPEVVVPAAVVDPIAETMIAFIRIGSSAASSPPRKVLPYRP